MRIFYKSVYVKYLYCLESLYDEDELEDEDEGFLDPPKLEKGSPGSVLTKTPPLVDSSTERDINDSEGRRGEDRREGGKERRGG